MDRRSPGRRRSHGRPAWTPRYKPRGGAARAVPSAVPCISALVTTSAAAATSSAAASSPNLAWASWARRKRRTPARSSPRPKPIDAAVSGGRATAEKSRMKMRGSANAAAGHHPVALEQFRMGLLHPRAQVARERRHVVRAEHRDRERLVHDVGRRLHPQVVRGLRGSAAGHGAARQRPDPLAVAGVTAQPLERGAGRLALAAVETGRVGELDRRDVIAEFAPEPGQLPGRDGGQDLLAAVQALADERSDSGAEFWLLPVYSSARWAMRLSAGQLMIRSPPRPRGSRPGRARAGRAR